MFIKKIFLGLCFSIASLAVAGQNANLIPDASFEAPVPVLFQGPGYYYYYLEKSKIDDAPDGTHVLDIRAWNEKGATILSQPLEFPTGTVTLTVSVRALNAKPDSKLAVALFDETGKREIARFGEIDLSTAKKWSVLSGQAPAPGGKVILALVPSGSSEGAVLQLDQLGLFAGTTVGSANNTVDWQQLEGESLVNGTSWKTRKGSWGWYHGVVSAGEMLDGSTPIDEGAELSVSKELSVNYPGEHTLWIRTLVHENHSGSFTVDLQQDNQEVASRTINSKEDAAGIATGPLGSWTWLPVIANLKAGKVTVRLTRPEISTSHVAREIDMVLLTNLPNYTPDETQLRPRVYVRWSNTGQGEGYSLKTETDGPTSGNLGSTGFTRMHRASAMNAIAPGQRTPWSDVTPFLKPQRGVNKLRFYAMRNDDLVAGPIKGTLDFALGEDKKIIRTVQIDQTAPRILTALNDDMARPDSKILTAYDYLEKEQAAVAKAKAESTVVKAGTSGQRAQYLDLGTTFYLNPGDDDERLIAAELKNLTDLGFNGLTFVSSARAIRDPEALGAFYRAHGLKESFGSMFYTWYAWINGDKAQPDLVSLEQRYKEFAETSAAYLPKLKRLIIADEPYGVAYDALVKSTVAQEKFRQFLQERNVTLQDINATAWDQVLPMTEEEKEANPKLFYYNGLFRLKIAADVAKANVAAKKKFLPDTLKTTVNYSPPYTHTWTEQGIDPFLMHRDGGLEMGCAEDWHGYSASPQYTSDTYALLRAAGQGQPLMGYMVVQYHSPLLKRIKYYAMIAAGARQICVYGYGPDYIGIDAWSGKHEYYPVLHEVQFELGNIDEALHDTQRRPTKIAILYNRTGAIWSGKNSSAEQDSRNTLWALSHAGYDSDFIPEEDIIAGKLDQYKVLYMGGIHLRQDVSQKIADWVKRGGVLFGSAGAASKNEFNEPQSTLEEIFGAKSIDAKMEQNAGRPQYELRNLKVLDTLKSADSQTSAVAFDQLCISETLEPQAGVTTLFTNETGKVMGTLNKVGRGVALRVAALPGLAYINHAVRDKTYNSDTYAPRGYDPETRDFLSLPARLANVPYVAKSNLESGEVTRYDAPGRSVLFVVNFGAEVKEDFSMLVPDATWAKKATCADGAKVRLTKEADGLTRVSFPLNVAGAVVLEE